MTTVTKDVDVEVDIDLDDILSFINYADDKELEIIQNAIHGTNAINFKRLYFAYDVEGGDALIAEFKRQAQRAGYAI